MYPTSMRINEEGRLVVNFKTEARFRGQFVMSHPGMSLAPLCIHSYPKLVPKVNSVQAGAYWVTLWPTSSLHLFVEFRLRGLSLVKLPKVIQANVEVTLQHLQLGSLWLQECPYKY